MSTKEYNEELYNAVDNIRDAFWLDDVVDDIETVMWYAGLIDDFKWADWDEWEELIKRAQEILNLDLGRWISDILLTKSETNGRIDNERKNGGNYGYRLLLLLGR